MKTKDKKDLQTKTKEELVKLLREANEAVAILNLDHQQNKLKNTRSIFNTRKMVAVLKTILRTKEATDTAPVATDTAKEVKSADAKAKANTSASSAQRKGGKE